MFYSYLCTLGHRIDALSFYHPISQFLISPVTYMESTLSPCPTWGRVEGSILFGCVNCRTECTGDGFLLWNEISNKDSPFCWMFRFMGNRIMCVRVGGMHIWAVCCIHLLTDLGLGVVIRWFPAHIRARTHTYTHVHTHSGTHKYTFHTYSQTRYLFHLMHIIPILLSIIHATTLWNTMEPHARRWNCFIGCPRKFIPIVSFLFFILDTKFVKHRNQSFYWNWLFTKTFL